MEAPSLDRLVDLDATPLHDPASARFRAAVDTARAGLQSDGCAVVRALVRPDALQVLSREISVRKPATRYSTQRMNPYFHTDPDPAYPADHPVNTFIERSSGFIPGDAWEPGCAMETLFRAPDLAGFLADCLDLPTLHCYADPLAGLTANILDPGQQFSWHFDTNEFAVTVLVDAADEGGLFQYVPNIRSAGDEGFDAIGRVLAGDMGRVRTLELSPGDMQIFRGRFSLHRVTRVGPVSRPRHAAIFAYTEQPGVIGRVTRTRQLFGRVLPAHEAAERERVRGDALID